MAKGHGGPRPGAGRKKAETVDYQVTMRAQFEAAVTPDDWREIITEAVGKAKAGDSSARAWLTPWLVGAEPREVTVRGDADQPVVFVLG